MKTEKRHAKKGEVIQTKNADHLAEYDENDVFIVEENDVDGVWVFSNKGVIFIDHEQYEVIIIEGA